MRWKGPRSIRNTWARSNELKSVRHSNAIVALANALGMSAAALFQFDKEENSEKVLRRKIEGLISKASAEELQRA